MSLIYFFIGIGLSMDAFSLSLSLGTTNPNFKCIIKTSITIGIFHFFMPIIGYIIGLYFNTKINNINILTAIIFLLLSIEIYRNRNNEEISIEEIKKCIRIGVLSNSFYPVLCETGLGNKGITFLLDAVVDNLPSPVEVNNIEATDMNENKISIKIDDNDNNE